MKRNRRTLLRSLRSMGIKRALADQYASADGRPAIILRWDGIEEYYTGETMPEYVEWLKKTFADVNIT